MRWLVYSAVGLGDDRWLASSYTLSTVHISVVGGASCLQPMVLGHLMPVSILRGHEMAGIQPCGFGGHALGLPLATPCR